MGAFGPYWDRFEEEVRERRLAESIELFGCVDYSVWNY